MEERKAKPLFDDGREEIARLLQPYTFHPNKKRKLAHAKPQDEHIAGDAGQQREASLTPDETFTEEEVLDSSSVPVLQTMQGNPPNEDVTIKHTRKKRKGRVANEDEG